MPTGQLRSIRSSAQMDSWYARYLSIRSVVTGAQPFTLTFSRNGRHFLTILGEKIPNLTLPVGLGFDFVAGLDVRSEHHSILKVRVRVALVLDSRIVSQKIDSGFQILELGL